MLTRIDLKHFKCFELLRLPLAPLTLLSGANSSGKSSVLQALVLFQQTMREYEWSTNLILNGKSIRLGTVSDVIDNVYGRKTFEVGIADEDKMYHWSFKGEQKDLAFSVEKITADDVTHNQPDSLRYLLPMKDMDKNISFARRMSGMTYLTAERLGPRETYTLEDRQVAIVAGPSGEYAASILYWGKEDNNKVLPSLEIPDVTNTLYHQVNARMQQFFPGFSLDLQRVPNTNTLTLGMRTSDETKFHRPVNVGFGLLQVFPIVVAALSAEKDDIILIENPEIHLHPAGQAFMGQFLASVAATGVQVIVETHSDHVLNGIRRSVKVKEISPDQVAIHFFRPRTTEKEKIGYVLDKLPEFQDEAFKQKANTIIISNIGAAQVISPLLDSTGNIDSWPEGFFDQFDKDMNYFAGWGE